MHKVDPRTGKLILSGQRRLPRPPPSSPVKKANVQSAEVVVVHQPAAPVDMEILLAAAREIGKAIAAEMKDVKPQQVVVHQSATSPTHSLQTTPSGKPMANITIDEGVADVGIGTERTLKKGEGSAKLAKAEVKADKTLSRSKSKLQALKKGRKI